MERRERDMLLGKIEEWLTKARCESDPFNKYVSIFTTFNIFYNLYEKTIHPSADLTHGEGKGAVKTLGLLEEEDQLVDSFRQHLEDYIKTIPVFREEYWPAKRAHNRVGISRGGLKRLSKKKMQRRLSRCC